MKLTDDVNRNPMMDTHKVTVNLSLYARSLAEVLESSKHQEFLSLRMIQLSRNFLSNVSELKKSSLFVCVEK